MPRHLQFMAALAVAFGLGASGLLAQGAVDLGGLSTDPSAPVEVRAQRLEVDRDRGVAAFSGDVVVSQGPMRLSAPRITVQYLGTPGDGGEAEGVERITAEGGVTLVTAEEAAEAAEAVYSPPQNRIVMTGRVLLTQGANTLSGDRLEVDLATGTGRIEGSVRTILQGGAAQ